MYNKSFAVEIEGIEASHLIFNNEAAMFSVPAKTRTESYEEHEETYWLHKAHLDSKSGVIIPGIWIKKMLIASQGQSACPIRPEGARRANATLKDLMISCVQILDSKVSNKKGDMLTKENLVPFKKCVNRGTYSAPKKVPVIRPCIENGDWKTVMKVVVLDKRINAAVLQEVLTWGGIFNGMGDWRPQRAGSCGMFTVIKVTEVE